MTPLQIGLLGVTGLLGVGCYGLLITRNLIKIVIALQVLVKGGVPRSFLQPNVLKKTDLQGTWHYLQTVMDVPPTNGSMFIGLSSELMKIRFSAKQIEALCDSVRKLVEEVRTYERNIMQLTVDKAQMPRAHFIKEFPGKEVNLRWVKTEIEAGAPWGEALSRFEPAIMEQQQKLAVKWDEIKPLVGKLYQNEEAKVRDIATVDTRVADTEDKAVKLALEQMRAAVGKIN